MKDPLCFFELQAVNEPKRVELPRRDNRREQRINIKIPACYQLLDRKNVLPDVFDGEVVDISYGGMLLYIKYSIEQFSDIKLNMLLTPFSKNLIDLYAKAVYVQANEGGSEVGLEFTIVDNNANSALKHYVDNII
ncbi:MAG: PilZ domain-containing protein [Gammaproteobacteria bacterium]|nr:PilZ domain-containing protein [Gammaproteobacteria bacterium]